MKKEEKKKGKKATEKTKEEKKEEEKQRFCVCSCVSVTTPGRHNAKSGVSSSWQ
jgi:16S rRNA G527 N7-methylase RsmG